MVSAIRTVLLEIRYSLLRRNVYLVEKRESSGRNAIIFTFLPFRAIWIYTCGEDRRGKYRILEQVRINVPALSPESFGGGSDEPGTRKDTQIGAQSENCGFACSMPRS